MRNRYVIERRGKNGQLVFGSPQPEDYFGVAAITGIGEDAMAKAVYRHKPDAVMTGMDIPRWPSNVHPEFVARVKTW